MRRAAASTATPPRPPHPWPESWSGPSWKPSRKPSTRPCRWPRPTTPLARSPHGVLPVIAADGSYLGAATARTAAETLADGAHDSTTVAAVTHLPRPVTIGSDLSNAFDALVSANGAGPPSSTTAAPASSAG
ncbi:hypothetical protein ACWGCW_38525 [Streptomyces sp. NPDC054933]